MKEFCLENIKQVMAPGDLDSLTKELVYIAVSVTNNCGYCIASHTAAARAKGMTEEQLAELFAARMEKSAHLRAKGSGSRYQAPLPADRHGAGRDKAGDPQPGFTIRPLRGACLIMRKTK